MADPGSGDQLSRMAVGTHVSSDFHTRDENCGYMKVSRRLFAATEVVLLPRKADNAEHPRADP